MKRFISIILILCILSSLVACGKSEGISASSDIDRDTQGSSQKNLQNQTVSTRPMTEGWLMTRVDMPAKMPVSAPTDYDGDWLWLSGRSQVDGVWRLLLLGLDTISGQWQQIALDLKDIGVSEEFDIRRASTDFLSVCDGMAWMRVECSNSDDSLTTAKLVTVDTVTKEANATDWTWEKAHLSESQYLLAFAALSRDQAVIITETTACIIDRNFNLQAENNIEAYRFGDSCRIGDQLYLVSDEGITRFDTQRLCLDRSIDFDPINWNFSVANSLPGNILYSVDGKLYAVQDSGQTNLVLDWMDVAVSRNTMALSLFENAKGEYYGCADAGDRLELVKVTKAWIPVKDTLTLACFINTQGGDARSYMNFGMQDAILAYNHSDAAYRIEPVYFEYDGDQDLNRALIEAFTADIDLVDQSNLPEGRISGEQLLDLLPYLDADPELNREDFFPAALRGMCAGGHLFRINPSYSVLGLNIPTELYPGQENWSCAFLERAIANDPSLAMGWSERYTQDYIVHAMAYAITGEFIDLDSMSCDFTRDDFFAWLHVMVGLIGEAGLAEDKVTLVCGVENDCISESINKSLAYYGERVEKLTQHAGIPDSKGNGFYLLSPAAASTVEGEDHSFNIGISVAKGCKDGQAAWDFAKLLLHQAARGIPSLRPQFESLMDDYARTFGVSQAQIDSLREIVENAAGTVVADPVLIDMMVAELNAFVDGKQSAQVTSEHLQSRISIYLAERS